jgi:hypothetical protein
VKGQHGRLGKLHLSTRTDGLGRMVVEIDSGSTVLHVMLLLTRGSSENP